jgi:hypothetical protein
LSMQLILGEERREGTPAASRERGTGETTGWKCTVQSSTLDHIGQFLKGVTHCCSPAP